MTDTEKLATIMHHVTWEALATNEEAVRASTEAADSIERHVANLRKCVEMRDWETAAEVLNHIRSDADYATMCATEARDAERVHLYTVRVVLGD